MDAASDPLIHTLVLMWSSQVGKTELLNNICGYFIHQDPSPILVVMPTKEIGHAWSADRLAPMIRDSPELARLFRISSRDSSNTLEHKVFPGGHVTIAGANSASSLSSRPIRVLLLDEVDRYPRSAGTEGDPVSLAMARTKRFWNRKIVMTSTPTLTGFSRIATAFNESDRRHLWVACPGCDRPQRLRWKSVVWDKTTAGDHLPHTAAYECERCKERWADTDRWRAVAQGVWHGEEECHGIAGFHLNEIYSPWTKLEDMVAEWVPASKDRERLKAFVNTALGETFDDDGDEVEMDTVLARREEYKHPAPEGVLVVVAGVDVQIDRLEYEIVGFGRHAESWSLQYGVIWGDPAGSDVWTDLDDVLEATYEGHGGQEFPIAAAAVDSGGQHTTQVYQYCVSRQIRRIYAVKGRGGEGLPVIAAVTKRPVPESRRQVRLFTLGVDDAKRLLYSRLQVQEPGPGYCHFPIADSHDRAYFEGLTAEKQVPERHRGTVRRVWKKRFANARNEPLDCRVYAMGALAILNPNWDALAKRAGLEPEKPAKPAAPTPARAKPSPGQVPPSKRQGPRRPRRNWVKDF